MSTIETDRAAESPHSSHWARTLLPLWAALLVAAVGSAALVFVGSKSGGPPFGIRTAHPALDGLRVITPTDALAGNVTGALVTLGGGGTIPLVDPVRRQQYVVGRLQLGDRRAPFGSTYDLVVIDNRLHRPVALLFPALGHSVGTVAAGWDSGIDRALRQYRWLHVQPAPPSDNGIVEGDPQAVTFRPGAATSIPFVGVLDRDSLPVTDLHHDLTVALVLTGPDQQVWWATRLN